MIEQSEVNPRPFPLTRGGTVDSEELRGLRNCAHAAATAWRVSQSDRFGNPNDWSKDYAEDVPRLLDEIEKSAALNAQLWNRLRFAEMVLDRNAVTFDGLPWRQAARLREVADGIDKPETAPEPQAIQVRRRVRWKGRLGTVVDGPPNDPCLWVQMDDDERYAFTRLDPTDVETEPTSQTPAQA